MAKSEKRFTASELKKMSDADLAHALSAYIEIGIDWNFEEAEVIDGKWADGRLLRDELDRRFPKPTAAAR